MSYLAPLFHGEGGNSPWQWAWEPSILIGLAVLTAAYLLAVGPLRRRLNYGGPVNRARIMAFLSGNLVVFIALVSPIDHISDEFLFSAHMVQHILLISIAPVLWLLGLPDGLLNSIVKARWLRRVVYEITRPLPAFLIFNFVLLVWHVPALYDGALENESLHIVEHLTFMAAAVIGWWPVFGRFEEAAPRANLSIQLFYVFLMMFPSTALAAWATLSQSIIYPFYGDAPREFGLSPMDDQQLAGLIMWIPGNALNFFVFTWVFFRWFKRNQKEEPEDFPALPETAKRIQE